MNFLETMRGILREEGLANPKTTEQQPDGTGAPSDEVLGVQPTNPEAPLPDAPCPACAGPMWWRLPGTVWRCSRCAPMPSGPTETVFIPEGYKPEPEGPTVEALRCSGCSRSVPTLHHLGDGSWRCLNCVEARPVQTRFTL